MSDVSVPSLFNSVKGIGVPVRVYKTGGMTRSVAIILYLAGIVVACGITAYGVIIYPSQFPAFARLHVPAVVTVALLLLLGVILGAWHLLSTWNEVAVVYSNGLAFFNGNKILVCKWNEIASIATVIVRFRPLGFFTPELNQNYVVTHLNGKQIKIDDSFPQARELYEDVRQQASYFIMTRCRQEFNAGQLVQFGPLALSKSKGIVLGDKTYPWSDIAFVGVEQGTVFMRPKTGSVSSSFSVPVASTANVEVFLALVNEVIGHPVL